MPPNGLNAGQLKSVMIFVGEFWRDAEGASFKELRWLISYYAMVCGFTRLYFKQFAQQYKKEKAEMGLTAH